MIALEVKCNFTSLRSFSPVGNAYMYNIYTVYIYIVLLWKCRMSRHPFHIFHQ